MSNHKVLYSEKLLIISDLSFSRIGKRIGHVFLALFFLSVLSSCIKEKFDSEILNTSLQINPGVAVPIGWAHYRLDEMLADSLNPDELIIDSDGFISFVYKQDLFSAQASEIIDIPDVSENIPLSNNTGIPIDLSLNPGNNSISYTIRISIPVNGSSDAEIDSILFRSGMLEISAVSNYSWLDWDAKLLFQDIPEVLLNNINNSESVPLDGKTIHLENSPTASNQLVIEILLSIRNMSGIIPSGPIIDFTITLNDLEYSAIYGYLGDFNIDLRPVSFPVNFYNNLESGTFHFRDPFMNIGFLNSFGIPVQITFNNFYATGSNGQITFITVSDIPGRPYPKTLAYPEIGQEGKSIADSMILDSQNTNLFVALESSPSLITVGANGRTNPSGVTHDNFLLDTSSLSISTELVLPMEGYANILFIADTLDFVFGDFYESTPDEIKLLIFRLDFRNQFPVSVSTQLYFLDENFIILDSLFHNPLDERMIVEGAKDFDSEGKAIVNEPEPVDIELIPTQIDNISGSHYIIVKGGITTSGYYSSPPENVRFYAEYIFHAHISAIAQLEINSDDY